MKNNLKCLLLKVAEGEKSNGAFQTSNQREKEEIDYLFFRGLVNKFDFLNGCAATLTSKGSTLLKDLKNSRH